MNKLLKIYAFFLFVMWGMVSKHILDYFNIYPFNNHYVESQIHFSQKIKESGSFQYISVIPLHSKDLHSIYSDLVPPSYFQDRHQSSVHLECTVPYSKSMHSLYIETSLISNGKKIQSHYRSMAHVPTFSFSNRVKSEILKASHLHSFDEIEIIITTHDNNFVYNDCQVQMTHLRFMFDSNAFYFMVVLCIIYTGVVIHAGRKIKSKFEEVKLKYST